MSDEAIRRQPGFEGLDDTTLAVRRLISAAQDLTVRTAQGMGMNVTDMSAILLLSQDGPMGVTELARRLGVTPPAATVLADRLARAGLAERVPDAVDRRRVRVSETAIARAATRDAWSPVVSEIDAVCHAVPQVHQDLVRHFLERLIATMTRSDNGVPAEGDVRGSR